MNDDPLQAVTSLAEHWRSSDDASRHKYSTKEMAQTLREHMQYRCGVDIADAAAVAAAGVVRGAPQPDAEPCSSCEKLTGNPDGFCDECRWDEIEAQRDAARAELAALQQRIRALAMTWERREANLTSPWMATELRAALAGAAPAEPEPSSAELERMLTDPDDGVTIVRGER